MALPKLVKGKRYVITGAAPGNNILKPFGIKYPQSVLFDGIHFRVKDKKGITQKWFPGRFIYKPLRIAKVEIYKSRGEYKFRVKAANGKKLNHQFNDKRSCKRGIEALQEALCGYIIVDLTK